MHFSHYALFASVSVSAILLSSAAYSLPQGGSVAAGNATITSSGPVAIVTQGSDRAVIDWRSFDVGAGEAVTFKQPLASSVTLNRIHDQKPSEIFGKISANGQVILSNPNGMIFGKGSRVDVAGLIATTADISNRAFMQGDPLTFDRAGKPDARIANEGTITAREAGLVGLVAPTVENRGWISATLGKVHLAGAETATVDLYGDGLLSIAVTDAAKRTLVQNSGTLVARAGEVLLTSAEASHLVSSAVNLSGVADVSASRINPAGIVTFGDRTGGRIAANGRDIALQAGAILNASGPAGGGTIHVGGGWQGKKLSLGTSQLANAHTVTIKKGASLLANATNKGDGGTVVVWSDGTTVFDGRITVTGGAHGGDGGRIETSGKEQLGVTGTVDAAAPKGIAGNWLLDPTNVTITQTGGTDVTGGSCGAGPYSCADLSVSANSISAGLSAGNNITITATGDIALSSASITSSSPSDVTLTLKAGGNITTIGTNAIMGGTSGAVGKMHAIFWSDADNSGAGRISIFSSITTNGGDIILGGGLDDGSDYFDPYGRLLIDGIPGDGRPDGLAMASNGSAALLQGSLQTAGGKITLLGGGGGGVTLTAGTSGIDTGGGNIVLGGTGFAQLLAAGDIHTRGGEIWISNQNVTYIIADTYTIDTGGGAIHTVSGLRETGVVTYNGGKVVTGSGNIILEGMGGTNPLGNSGVRVVANLATQGGDVEFIAHGGGIQLFDNTAGPSVIATQGGNVTLTGEAATGSGLWIGTETLLGGSPAQFIDVGTLTIRGRGSPTATADPYGTAAGIVIAGPWDVTGVDHLVLDGQGMGTTALNAGILFLDLSPAGLGLAAPSIGSSGATADLTILTDTIAQVATADLLSFTAPSMPIGIQTAGTVTLAPHTPAKTIGVAGGTGDVQLPAFLLDGIDAGNITIGDATSGLITVNPYVTWASRASSGVSFLSGPGGITFMPGAHDFSARSLTAATSGPLTANGAITAGNAMLRTTGTTSDITIGAAGSLTASGMGDALTLASGRNFINNAGTGALSAPAGRWLVYSGSPASNANGGLLADFTRYGCDYGACTGFTPGLDGFLYREVVNGGSSGDRPGGGLVPATPVTPPVPPSTGAGGGPVPAPLAPVAAAGLPDFIRKQDLVTRIQVNASPGGGAFPASGTASFLVGDGGLEDGVTPPATQKEIDSRISADDRRRRWFSGELYTVSPDLARDLEGE